jgi:photosystem II stability/assembly factor-like uncharacterized protein
LKTARGRPAILRPVRAQLATLSLLCATLSLTAIGGAFAQDEDGDPSLIKPLAQSTLLLDGASAGDLTVAVGARGHILLSHDQGSTWSQAQVPVRATLTGVFLLDENLGWVVGHDAVILRTRDGGETWAMLHSAPEERRPLLDVWFRDEFNGFAIGAYGFFLVTSDGGQTWTDRLIVEPDVDENDPYAFDSGADLHLNHIARSDSGRLYIAAEAGAVFRSDDDGETWLELPSPYGGSFFGSLPLGGESLLLFGLRGHLFRSDDAGETWSAIETRTEAMLTDGIHRSDGSWVLAGLAGVLLVSHDGGTSFDLLQQPDRQGLSSILSMKDGSLILVGEYGVNRLDADALGGTTSP